MSKKSSLLAFVATALLAGCAPKVQTTQVQRTVVAAEDPPAPLPALHAADFVGLDALTSNHFVLADKPGEIELRVRLTAKPRKGGKRPPINLGLVVDTSGSMEGSAIEDARSASLALLDALEEGDRLALVVFHSVTEVLVPSVVLTKDNIAEIRAKIRAMKASGTTDLAGGLSAGLTEVSKSFQAEGINRVVLLGDGVPNDSSQLAGLAQSAGQRQISITALGLGLDYDETLMSQLALSSGGKYHFVRESSEVAKVFSSELLRLKEVVGRGLTVALAPGPGVTVKEVIGLPTSQVGGKSNVVIGDLSEGEERDVLVRLTVPARHAGSVVELLDVEVGFDPPGSQGRRVSERTFVSVKATAEAAEIDKGRERDIEHSVAKLSVAEAIVRAVAVARKGSTAMARAILDAAEKEAKAAAKEFDDKELAEQAKSIGPLRKTLASLAPPPQPPPPPPGGWGPPGGAGPQKPAMAPAPAPMAPADAAMVMKSQAAAMSTIQGP